MCKTLSLALAMMVLGVCGCKVIVREGAAPGVRVRDPRAPQAGIRMNTVNIIDRSLQDWEGPDEKDKRGKIAVESTNSRRTGTGTLEVWAVLRNRTNHPLQIEGRTQFFDRDRAPAETATAWQRVYLAPQSLATYKEFSTKTGQVAYYYIEIREGR